MIKRNERRIKISEELAAKMERIHYIFEGRKCILDAVMRNENGAYSKEMLEAYLKKYDEAFVENQQMVEFVKTEFLTGLDVHKMSFYVEMSTSTLVINVCEKCLEVPEEKTDDR